MKRTTIFLSLFAFIAIVFLSVSSVLAQTAPARPGYGLIQANYNEYARLFKEGKEPNLSPSEAGNLRWRGMYRDHRWAEYAAGSEFREPMLAAQTLMGIYLAQDVDHKLTYQVETIIWNKAHISANLAERIKLDEIADYWSRSTDPILQERMDAVGEGNDFYSDYELEQLALQRRDIDRIARERIVNPNRVSRAMRSEVENVRNLFDHGESHRNWVITYYFMREKFDILDELASMFTFNWSDERRRAAQDGLETDEKFLRDLELIIRRERAAQQTAQANLQVTALTSSGSGSGSSGSGSGMMLSDSSSSDGSYEYDGSDTTMFATGTFGNMSDFLNPGMRAGETPEERTAREEREIYAEVQRRATLEAANNFDERVLRENAYKYVVGVYESTDFHLGTLRRIHRYFRNGAEAGDPVAQYHLALFLYYLGDIVDPFTDEATRLSEANQLMAEAEKSDVTKDRVRLVREQLAREARLLPRREADRMTKVNALWKVENDKIDMFDVVLLGVRDRISSGTGVGSRIQMGQRGMMGGMMGGGMGGSGSSSGFGSSGGNNRNSSSNSSSGSSSSSSY